VGVCLWSHRAFKKVIRIVYESAEARFPGSGYRTLGGVIFLRLFCPAIVAPEAHNLSATPGTPALAPLVFTSN